MPLTPNTRLGAYEILAAIGAGGMGEVYRARDMKLGREVAIKVLPEEFTQHPQKLARFEREARLLAALNHPGIATLHGFEKAKGMPFLVMELVEGETLAERIARGPLPVTEALTLSQQIADALEAAHEKGVIHRDLKPANIKVNPEGHVKVLDFGLAKAFADEVPESELSASPTLSRDATKAGVILGTAAYMSPEQAKGKTVDKRTDIFSFGIVLYEMLTGKRAFAGEDVSEVLAHILTSEPDWKALSGNVPPSVVKLLGRCLTKDRKNRLRDIGDARFEIQEILAEPRATSEVVKARAPVLAWGLTVLIAALLSGITVWSVMQAEPPAQTITRFAVTLPPGEVFMAPGSRANGRLLLALSPDGTRLVYVANQQLYLREMDQMEATPIRGTDIAPTSPFFSPDGQWVGFWANNNLWKVSVTGGAPVALCEAANPFGASWGADDTIVFGQGAGGILRVSANGGTPEVLIPMDSDKNEMGQGPQMLPDGKTVLFALSTTTVTTLSSLDESQIVTQSLETGERRLLIEGGSDARYVPTGHLVYALGETLLAVPFDLARLTVTGGPVPVVEGVGRAFNGGAAHASFSDSGSLVYVQGRADVNRNLVWVDRDGREEALSAEPRAYTYPRISPDGNQVALDVRDQEFDIWIWDFARETLRRLTFSPEGEVYPTWTPDGRRVAFMSDRDGGRNLFWKAADGTGTVERLTESENGKLPYFFSTDGEQLVYREDLPLRGNDLGVRSMDGDGSLEPLLVTEFNELNAEISPDGRWLAYQSDASGQYEIYVRPFPNVDQGLRQISRGGGTRPLWARDGSELFYLDAGSRLMAVSVRIDPSLDFGNPEVIFEESYPEFPGADGRNYDVSLNGERFLMLRETEETGVQAIHVVLNWFDELKRLVPTN